MATWAVCAIKGARERSTSMSARRWWEAYSSRDASARASSKTTLTLAGEAGETTVASQCRGELSQLHASRPRPRSR